MDVPTRQSIRWPSFRPKSDRLRVDLRESRARPGAALSPLFVGFMFARPSWINMPFFLAGGLKILYDLLLYKEFVSIPPVEERS
jgi:hypothetical protein